MTTEGFPDQLKDQYTPLETLGAGAMGVVFKAWDKALGRPVAIKLMGGDENARTRTRFLHEAAALAKLKHPNVVGVFAYGVLEDRGPYIVMEFLEGAPLDRPPRGTDPLQVMLQVADGLDEIHRAGLVHRDLKLPNVMLTAQGRAVIVDFGLVLDPSQTRVTRQGAFVGTFMVGAPEVLHLEKAVQATDWYAWGLNLYLLCEGRFPFTFPELMAVTKHHPLPEPRFQKLADDSPLASLIRRCLAEDPAERPSSRDEVLALLREDREAGSQSGNETTQLASMELDLLLSSADPSTVAEPPTGLAGGAPSSAAGARPLPWQVVGAVLALALGLHGLMRLSGRGGGPSGGSTTVPFPEDFPASLARELADLEVTEPGALDPDPTRWGALLSRLPRLGRYLEWVGEGGRPETLPVPLADALRGVGGAFLARGLEDPFDPSLHVLPSPTEVARPPSLIQGELAALRLPERARGWLGASLAALDQAVGLHARLEARLNDPGSPPPPELPASLWARRQQLQAHGLLDFVRRHSHDRTFRVAVSPWLRPGVVWFRRALYAAGRSIREEAETREALACLFSNLGGRVSAFFYSHHQYADLAPLLGGPPNSAAGWLLRGDALRLQRLVRRRSTELQVSGVRRAEVEAFERAAEPGEGEMAQRRRSHAVAQLLQRAREDGDGARMRTLLDAHRAAIGRAPDAVLIWMIHDVLELASRTGSGLTLAPGEAEGLRREVAEVLARQPPEAFREVRALVSGRRLR